MNTPEAQPIPPEPDSAPSAPSSLPWLTYAIAALCAAIFFDNFLRLNILLGFISDLANLKVFGQYWLLLASAFMHVDPLHAAFNIYWALILFPVLERQMGWQHFLLFILCSAFVSSSFQLATGHSGIGLSGVIYAAVGYIMLMRKKIPYFQVVLDDNLVRFFIVWLFACIVLTWLGILNIGNAAHFSGFFFGIAVAGAFGVNYKRPLLTAVMIAMFLFAFIPPVWTPWLNLW